MRLPICVSLIAFGFSVAFAQPKTLIEWTFDKRGDLEGWTQRNHVDELRVEDGALCGRVMNWDPFVRGPQFELQATLYQRLEVRIKTNCGGYGEFFWTNTTESKYDGFSAGKETPSNSPATSSGTSITFTRSGTRRRRSSCCDWTSHGRLSRTWGKRRSPWTISALLTWASRSK